MNPMLRSFFGAIDADPSDPVNRLVFADWLEENGHTELAQEQRLLALQSQAAWRLVKTEAGYAAWKAAQSGTGKSKHYRRKSSRRAERV